MVGRDEKIDHLVPEEIDRFIEETGCFSPGMNYQDGEEVDQYKIRTLLIERLCKAGQGENGNKVFRSLMATALSETPNGIELRKALPGDFSTSDLLSKFISDSD